MKTSDWNTGKMTDWPMPEDAEYVSVEVILNGVDTQHINIGEKIILDSIHIARSSGLLVAEPNCICDCEKCSHANECAAESEKEND